MRALLIGAGLVGVAILAYCGYRYFSRRARQQGLVRAVGSGIDRARAYGATGMDASSGQAVRAAIPPAPSVKIDTTLGSPGLRGLV